MIRSANNPAPANSNFSDQVILITHAYLVLRAQYINAPSRLIVVAAERCGWKIEDGGHVAALIERIARASKYSTPLIREEKWDQAATVQALKEWV
jgi:hypothetical protein